MSIKNVHRAYVVCDTCGAERMALATDATMARISAASEGWKFIKYDRWTNGVRKGSVRAWDACPDCELPATPEDAAKIRDEREEAR